MGLEEQGIYQLAEAAKAFVETARYAEDHIPSHRVCEL